MISPEEKAKELLNKFFNKDFENIWNTKIAKYEAKQCALLCVNEVLSLYADNKYDSRYSYYEAVQMELHRIN